MNYEYNGHLLTDERVKLVADEIVACYPQISLENAKEAAILEGSISKEATAIDKLNRLYNIMLVSRDDKKIVSKVYKDYLNILNNTPYEEELAKYVDLIDGIDTFLNNNADFPFISDLD